MIANGTNKFITIMKGKKNNMQNTIVDLTNHLFEQLERLNNDELTTEEIVIEGERTKAMVDASKQILDVFKLEFDAVKFSTTEGFKVDEVMPKQLVTK